MAKSIQTVRATGVLFLTFVLLFGVTFAILASALGWPASLHAETRQIFSLLAHHPAESIAGYYTFLIVSLLIVPCALLMKRVFGDSPWMDVAVGFALLAAGLRILGIFRWMFLVPDLAGLAGTSNGQELHQLELIYRSFSNYTDGFGTHLGDQLLTRLWIGLASVPLLSKTGFLRSIDIFGLTVFAFQVFGCVTDFFWKPNPTLSIVQSTVFLWALLWGATIAFHLQTVSSKKIESLDGEDRSTTILI